MSLFDAVGGVVGSGIGAIAGAVQGHKNREFQREMQNKQNEFTERMWNQQNEWNLEQWDRENAYNSPSQQIGRLLDAGINPNSIFSGDNPNVDASSMQADSVSGASASGSGVTSDLSHLGADMIQNAANIGNYLMDQKNKAADLKLKQQQGELLEQQKMSNQIQLFNDAMFSNQERRASINAQVQSTAESRARENKFIQELENSKLDAQEKKIAISFAKEHNSWLLKMDKQQLDNLGQAYKELGSRISANNASASLSRQQERNAKVQEGILSEQNEQAKVETSIAKNTQKDREAAIRAGAKNEEEQAAYLEWRNQMLQSGIDPDAPSSVRMWQSTLEEWRNSGNKGLQCLAWTIRTIGATVEKAGSIVGPMAGAAAGAYFGGKGAVNKMTAPKSTNNPLPNTGYQGSYGSIPGQSSSYDYNYGY